MVAREQYPLLGNLTIIKSGRLGEVSLYLVVFPTFYGHRKYIRLKCGHMGKNVSPLTSEIRPSTKCPSKMLLSKKSRGLRTK